MHEPTGDIRVEAFALRPDPYARGLNGVGAQKIPLAEVGGGFDPGGDPAGERRLPDRGAKV